MDLIKRVLTWWHSQTLGTQLFTWRKGIRVGEDLEGNVFYQTKDGLRRWIVYNGAIEASRVSPEWHGWLHYTFSEPPTEEPLSRKKWEKDHIPNLTGTSQAYVPKGSLRNKSNSIPSDYTPWKPE
ncbi:MAG: NADH:ubiquinone oxidoreductase subunit NDUFA12 [Rhodobacteraceae bacterium]|nr:NADH:ubiquinone oxidoreductase subunit NDUFA12 [Paracoccaceae bacterium]